MNDATWLVARDLARERIAEANAVRLQRRASIAELERRTAVAPPAINLRFAAILSWLVSLVRN